ncbi:hypothetical protein EI94DRAFT_1063969 [Lactarius quietus]|nr:hypothetical protein EI94DRAFT_1063969 [Lactarius quietus]
MVSIFKCTKLISVLSLMLVYQSLGFPSRYLHVAAAATTGPPISVVTVTVTATPSSVAPTPAPIPTNDTVVPSSALPTNTAVPGVPTPTSGQPPNSFPQNSTMTSGIDFDPSWQEFYLVTQGLPNITFPLGNNYAGNLPVGRSGHPNNTLFFWGFENIAGSLAAPASEMQLSPWLIWLGGGGGYEFDPRSSSDS